MDVSAQERLKYPDEGGTDQDTELAADVAGNNKFSVEELSKTERGRELVEQLRELEYSRSTMGEKHPLLPKVKEDIDRIKGLLRNRVVAEKLADEMDEGDEAKRLARVLPGMEDDDLRRLVLRLIVRVDNLEKEVIALKDELGDDSASASSASKDANAEAGSQEMKKGSEDKESGDLSPIPDDDELFGDDPFDET